MPQNQTDNLSIPKEIADLSFEEALDSLENLVRQLDSGKVKLDQAVEFYTKGTLLRLHCQQKLALAKTQIDQVSSSANGTIAGTTPLILE